MGEEKLAFKRLTTSRYKPAIPTPLGTGGSWRHSYYWNITANGTDPVSGGEIIHIDYPDATEHDFHKETSTSTYLTAVSSTQERVEKFASSPDQYYLWFPNGRHLWFKKDTSGGVTTFKVVGLFDKYSNLYSFTLDGKNRVTKVTEPGGRYISMSYGSIGNFPVGNIAFTYTNSAASTVAVVGDFNNWGTTANPMTNNNGTWTTTIPLQLGASYQYKFVVNGGTWISDPNNGNTLPPGGPTSGNNSLIKNGDLDTTNSSVPVSFSFANGTATTVAVAGSFNNWSTNNNQLTKSGSTWTGTISIPPGQWQYKLVVNGTDWQTDPGNQFSRSDGYGGYNSLLNVGPLDEAITQVQSSDGRFVTYGYVASVVGFTTYSALTSVSYGDSTAAHYTYSAPTIGSRPTLATANDPRYKGPLTQVAYTYQNNGVEGFVATEASLIDGTIVSAVEPSTSGERTVTTAGSTRHFTFAQGNVTTQYDSLNRRKDRTYFDNGWGMLSTTTEYVDGGATPYTTAYERTSQFGNVSKVTFPDTKTRITHYPNSAKPFFPDWITDENGNTTTYTLRDADGRPIRIDYATPSGSAPIYELFNYTATLLNGVTVNLLSSHRLKNGATESFAYYASGQTGGRPGDLRERTDASGHTFAYTYDDAGRKLSVVEDGDATQMTQFSYYDRGQLHTTTYADGTTESFQYDDYGNRTRVTDERGQQWNYVYDQYNRVIDVTEPHTDQQNHTTHYAYDLPSSGCGSCTIENHPTSITSPSGRKTVIAYDTEWQKTSVTVGAGSPDAATTYFGYDDVGNLISITDPRGKLWTYTFDTRHRQTRATRPPSSGSYVSNYSTFGYDGVGNKTSEKRSGDTIASTYTYDVADRLTQISDAKAQITKMTYDVGGNLATMMDPRTDQGNANTYTYAYSDGMNRKTGVTYPDGTTETWVYDGAGNPLTYKTRANQTETFTYDKRHRELTTSWSGTSAPGTTKTYFENGLVKTITSSVSSLVYTYDEANRLLSEQQHIAADTNPKYVTYSYDLDGNRTTIGYPSGSSVSLAYSGRNQLNNVSATGGINAHYIYDPSGNRLSKSLENGTIATYSYDDASRLLTVDNQNAASLGKYEYSYDTRNDRTSRTETIGGVSKVDLYSYDEIDQIISVRYNAVGGAQDRAVTYNYDKAGNRSGSAGISDTLNGDIVYAADKSNQYTNIGSLTPVYDNNGNMTGQDGWSYSYDALNRLVSAYSSSTNVVFSYDGRNRCVTRSITQGGTTSATFLYYNGWNLIEEQNSGNSLIARYVGGAKTDEMVARVTGGAITYYHQDALGSTVALTGRRGQVTERYTYDVFGTPTFRDGSGSVTTTSSSGNRFLFTGREYLPEVALYDYRSRVYSPQFGRFLQVDPLRFGAGDVNLYRYVRNGAAQFTDPTGLCCETETTAYKDATADYTAAVDKASTAEAGKKAADKALSSAERTYWAGIAATLIACAAAETPPTAALCALAIAGTNELRMAVDTAKEADKVAETAYTAAKEASVTAKKAVDTAKSALDACLGK